MSKNKEEITGDLKEQIGALLKTPDAITKAIQEATDRVMQKLTESKEREEQEFILYDKVFVQELAELVSILREDKNGK
jgi:phage-related minor tail protein